MGAMSGLSESGGPSPWMLAALFGLGGICLGVGAFGAQAFGRSEFAVGLGWNPTESAGYTAAELLGLTAGLYLCPLGALLWLVVSSLVMAKAPAALPTSAWSDNDSGSDSASEASSDSRHAKADRMRICVLVALSFSSVGLTVLGAVVAKASLACGVIFCTGSQDLSVRNMMNDPAGLGLLALGLVFLTACLMVLAREIRSARGSRDDDDAGEGLRRRISKKSFAASRRKQTRVVAGALLAGLVLPALLLLTAILPNTFEKFTPMALSSYMAQPVSLAEHPGAWMITHNWRVSDQLVLKFYPSTLIFYGFLETLALSAMAAAEFPALGRALGRRAFASVTRGEAGMLCALVVVLVLWTTYWVHDHSYHNGKAKLNTPLERVARTWGLTAVLFLSLALLPASKNSLWHRALGISWHRGLWMHRALGMASVVCMLLHVLSFWKRFAQLDCFPYDAFHSHVYYPLNGPKGDLPLFDNFTIPLMILVGYPSLLFMGVAPLLRDRHWELFRYTHYMFLVLIPAILLHASTAWHFMLGGIAFWLVDSGIRFFHVTSPLVELTAVKAHAAEGGFTELELSGVAATAAGQFLWLNIPAVSLWEWHPFSISSTPEDGRIRLCIKSMGAGTWTQGLHELACSLDAAKRPRIDVQIDGPYGQTVDLDSHAGLLLLAGGVGITQVHSTFRALSQLASTRRCAPDSNMKSIQLVWSGRSYGLFQIFAASIVECLDLAGCAETVRFSAVCYLTGEDKDREEMLASLTELEVRHGRPDFGELYDTMAAQVGAQAGKPLLVQACGPPSFVGSACMACAGRRDQVDFQASAFSF